MQRFIIGAAGTGKTRLLKHDIIKLLQDESPDTKILVLVSSPLIAKNIKSLFPVTVHTVKSLSEAALKDKYPELKIISNLKSWLILRKYIKLDSTEFKSNYRLVKEKPSFAVEVLELIQAAGINSIPIDQISSNQEKIGEIKNIYRYYTDFCEQNDLVPAFQIIPRALDLLNEYCRRFNYIFIDQYEDFCPGEIQAINELSRGHNNVTIFADSVRSNVPENHNIVLQTRFPNSLANHINRLLNKSVYTETESNICPLTIALESTAVDEAEYIARTIKKIVKRTGKSYSDFAILCRDQYNFGTILHDVLKNHSIPCSNVPGVQYDPNVQFIILFLQAIANPRNDELVLKWLTSSVANIDRIIINKVYKQAKEKRQDFFKSLEDKADNNERLSELLSILDFAEGEIQAGTSIHNIIEAILVKAGAIEPGKVPDKVSFFIGMVKDIEGTYEKRPRLSVILYDIRESMIQRFDSDVIISEDKNVVKIMSIWESRGLEFPIVFIPGMARDFFPARHPSRQLLYGEELSSVKVALRGIDLPGTVTFDRWKEQEKHLLYIAMTRAKEEVYLTFAKKYQYGENPEPSPFIIEILAGKELSAENCSQYGIIYHDHKVSGNIYGLISPDEIISKSDLEISFLRYIKETQHLGSQISQNAKNFIEDKGIINNIIPPEPLEEIPISSISDKEFSHSSIRTYLSCPRKYFFDKLLNIKLESNPNLTFGTLIHGVLNKFHREYPNLHGYDYEELWTSLNNILTDSWNNTTQPEFMQSKLQSKSYWKSAQELLKHYLNGECKRWQKGRVCIETENNFNFNFFGKYILTGRIDRIDNCIEMGDEIIDFKVSKDNIAESKLKTAFLNMDDDPNYKPQDYQLPIYYFAKSDDSKLKITKLVVYQLRTYSKREEAPFRREIDILDEDFLSGEKDKFITKGDLDCVKDDILKTLNKMTSGIYKPEPRDDNQCEECDFAFICDREFEE